MSEKNAVTEIPAENPGQGVENARTEMATEAFQAGGGAAAGAAEIGRSVPSLSETLLNKGLMPALDKNDIPATLVEAANLMKGSNIGLPSDGKMSSGTSISRLLQAVGADVRLTPFIPDLKNQLEKQGWESFDLKDKAQLKPGDIVFTSMEPRGRNAGIVGKDGIIFSHNGMSNRFEGRTNWSSHFVTVMRQSEK